jgi:hypothetical protein
MKEIHGCHHITNWPTRWVVLHCTVFGVAAAAGDAQKCTTGTPRATWSPRLLDVFSGAAILENAAYPNVDYADLHAYISTSDVGIAEAGLKKEAMGFGLLPSRPQHRKSEAGSWENLR